MDTHTPVVILCGGLGTRMKEETEFQPKPLLLVGAKPILWHIMKIYAHYGYRNFILALGYKGHMIKEYFLNQRDSDDASDDFHITFADTGLHSLTGERLLRIKKYVTGEEFMVTYGDGVADIDISALVAFHHNQGTIGTITGVHPYSKYGLVQVDPGRNLVIDFKEKPRMQEYVSGGFKVFRREAFDYFDAGPMENIFTKLIPKGQLSIYRHDGFWQSMDTYKEMEEMNKLWRESRPWAVWEAKSQNA